MATDTKTVHALATEARSWFDLKQRASGESFWATKDGRPDWLQDLCREAHAHMLPDDHRYAFIVEALDYLAEDGNDPAGDDYIPEADVYTSDLTAWLNSRQDRYAYVDQARSNGLFTTDTDTITQLQAGQIEEKWEIFHSVLTFLRDRTDADD